MNNYYSNLTVIQHTPTHPQLKMKPKNHIWGPVLQRYPEFNASIHGINHCLLNQILNWCLLVSKQFQVNHIQFYVVFVCLFVF